MRGETVIDESSVYQLPHLCSSPVSISLFEDVKNADYLRQHLIQGNPEFEYAFVDASKIMSLKHLLAAVFRAINDMQHSRLKSRNVHSEIVFALNPNNNIADSFRRFGLSPTTRHILAVKVLSPPASSSVAEAAAAVIKHLTESIEGKRVPLVTDGAISKLSDLREIVKIYKLDFAGGGDGGRAKNKLQRQEAGGVTSVDMVGNEGRIEKEELEAVVLNIMAVRGS